MKNVTAIIAAVLLGAIAVLAVSQYIRGIEEANAKENMEAVVAAHDITAGDKIKIDDLTTRTIKSDPSAIPGERGSSIAGMVAATAIKAGSVLRKSDFSETEKRFSKDMIPKGKRAVTLTVGGDTFAGMLVPGDVVDVLMTYQNNGQMPALNNPSTPGRPAPGKTGAGAAGGIVTGWMMQDVTIVALDNRTSLGVYNAEGADYTAKSYSNITIAVRPEEAQMITFAQQGSGVKMTFLLRNPDDHAPVENTNEMDYSWFVHLLSQSQSSTNH